MPIIKEENFKDNTLERIASEMCIAARTAPKTRGFDLIETRIISGSDIEKIISKLDEIFKRELRPAFNRNAESLKECSVIVLIGVKTKTNNLKPCGLCGFKDCLENEKNHAVCAFNTIDLGIALGSAVSIASDKRVDNRIMWTIGMAALELGIFDESVKLIMGIPLSAKGKNIFFDRK